MAYQKPRANHPWKTGLPPGYKEVKEKKRNVKPFRLFIREISTSWDTMEVVTFAYGREDRYRLNDLPQTKQASWLAGIIKRNYGTI